MAGLAGADVTVAWSLHSEWLPLPGSHSPDRIELPYQDQAAAEQYALELACCRGARYVSVQGPDAVVTFEWDRYTNIARHYRPPSTGMRSKQP